MFNRRRRNPHWLIRLARRIGHARYYRKYQRMTWAQAWGMADKVLP